MPDNPITVTHLPIDDNPYRSRMLIVLLCNSLKTTTWSGTWLATITCLITSSLKSELIKEMYRLVMKKLLDHIKSDFFLLSLIKLETSQRLNNWLWFSGLRWLHCLWHCYWIPSSWSMWWWINSQECWGQTHDVASVVSSIAFRSGSWVGCFSWSGF